VRRFLSWCDGEGVELASISPGKVGRYLTALGGSAAKRNQHLSALRGLFDRLVQRHEALLNPAASVRGVKETVVEGKTPEITIDQARKLIASVATTYMVKAKGQQAQESENHKKGLASNEPTLIKSANASISTIMHTLLRILQSTSGAST
jgi:site-specific recombinase XerD